MRHYETTYILRPNLGEDQFTEIIERTNAIVTDDGGSIITVDRWGIKKLAYEIKKETLGYYVYMNYAAHGTTVNEIERIFRIDDKLLRYLTIKLSDAIDAEGIDTAREQFAAQAAAAEAAEEETTGTSGEPAAPKSADADTAGQEIKETTQSEQ
ncbi:MAG: 30S ribosomal protein S6 [Desulfocapsa sp.]|nr:MAG: 30S ribosomal protein S6 [Desulfocapsa sp.]